MSRLLRATVRRDKSYALMNTLEEDNQERQVLNILECMKLILHDIDPKKIPTTLHKKKTHANWETICIMARIASLEGHWEVAVGEVDAYLPVNNHAFLQDFVNKWTVLRKNPNTEAMHFLRLLEGSKV